MLSSSEISVEATSTSEFKQQNYLTSTRYLVCLLLLISQGIAQTVVINCLNTNHLLLCFITQLLVAFLAAFAVQWCQIYSTGLTRTKRAFFDESNILETYQPRARTMGHLFMPEPPTPVPNAQRQQNDNTLERNAFLQMRDAHYGNEYTYVEKLNRELKDEGNFTKQLHNEVQDGIMSGTPKIEGPILIELHADSETDDDGDDDEYFRK